MPIIPLLPPHMLPDAPPTVLDRERRPTADFTGVASAAAALGQAARMPEIDAGPFVQALAGFSAAGRALAQTGDVFEALAMKRAEAQNDIDVANADATMEQTQAEYEQWKMQNPDPREWDAEWQRRSSGLKATLLSDGKLSQAAKDRIQVRSTTWQGRAAAMVARDAAKQTFALARSAGEAGLIRAMEVGDEKGFADGLQSMLDKGYIFPDDAARWEVQNKTHQEQQAKRREAQARQQQIDGITSVMEADPWQAKSLLAVPKHFPALDAQDRMRLAAAADQQARVRQSEAMEVLHDGIVTGEIDDKRIYDTAALVKLGPAEIQKLKDYRAEYVRKKAASTPMDWNEANAVLKEIEAYDPIQDKDGMQWAGIFQRATLATAHSSEDAQQTAGAFRSRLYAKHPFLAHPPAPRDPAFGLMKTAEDYLALYKQDGAFGPPSTAVDASGKAVENTTTIKNYINWRHKIMNDLQQASKQDPERFRDPGAVEDFIGKALKGAKAAAAVDALRMAPGADAQGGHDASLLPDAPLPTDDDIRRQFNLP